MDIVWSSEQIAHLATQSERYGPEAHDLVPAWTNEAINDPHAITEPIDPHRPYRRVITGHSPSYGDLLTVVCSQIEGVYYGITAYPAGRGPWLTYQNTFNA